MLQKCKQLVLGIKMAFLRNTIQGNEIAELVSRLAYFAELQEWDNRSHLSRISASCLLLSKQMGLSKSESEVIAIACMLHDVGKINTPIELLFRVGDYQPSEWKVIEKHTIDGAQFLSDSHIMEIQTGRVIAESHHERWDGSGYPYHRKGDSIPLPARICAVADVFDALTTPRPYKPASHALDAKKLIENSSGILFDPAVVSAFTKVFDSIVKM
jgi:putative two-component system response regulator